VISITFQSMTEKNSFTLWQQAATEITRYAHSIPDCSRHIHQVLFLGHIPFVVHRACVATPTESAST